MLNITIILIGLIVIGSLEYIRRSRIPETKKTMDGFTLINKEGNLQYVLIQSQKLCKYIFTQNTVRPSSLGLGDLFDRYIGLCLGCLNSKDPKWGQLKKIFRQLFNKKIDLDPLIRDWNIALNQAFDRSVKTGKPVSIDKLVHDLPLRMIIKTIFGPTFCSTQDDLFENLKKDSELIMYNIFNNKFARRKIYRFYCSEVNKVLARFKNNWERLLKLAECIPCVEKEGIYMDLLHAYQKTKLDWQYFSQTLVEIIYANQDVANPSMGWLLIHYALHPIKSSLVMDFIEESARMSPISPVSMPEITTKALYSNDIALFQGSQVVIDFMSLRNSSDWEMNDLDEFNPSRFRKVGSEFISRFGYGSRKCPGHKLANVLFHAVVTNLRDNWNLYTEIPTELSEIKKNPKKAFISPLHNLWITPKKYFPCDSLFYGCSPMSLLEENAFLAVSVNKRSPFLKDQKIVNEVINQLSSRNNSVVLICDDISQLNIQAFGNYKPHVAIKKARELGDIFVEIFSKAIHETKNSKVQVYRWNDCEGIPKDIGELKRIKILDNRVTYIADQFINHRGKGKINSSYQKKLGLAKEYIFRELPVLINGISVNDIHYRLMYYAGNSQHLKKFAGNSRSLYGLMMDIVQKEEFKAALQTIRSWNKFENLKVPGFVGIEI